MLFRKNYDPEERDRTYFKTEAISSSDNTNLHIPITLPLWTVTYFAMF